MEWPFLLPNLNTTKEQINIACNKFITYFCYSLQHKEVM